MKPKKLVQGVGINDAGYAVTKYETIGHVDGKQKQKLGWTCPYFQTWRNMLMRCYSAKYKKNRPTHKGCVVPKNWLTFSNFKSWMEKQDFEGKHLDKDLLFEGNKVYSAERCVFISPVVNTFTTDRGSSRGEWKIGVSRDKRTYKFRAFCRNPFTEKKEHLGYFTHEQQAHEAWIKRKLELAHELAAVQTDPRVAKALIERYSKLQISEKGT